MLGFVGVERKLDGGPQGHAVERVVAALRCWVKTVYRGDRRPVQGQTRRAVIAGRENVDHVTSERDLARLADRFADVIAACAEFGPHAIEVQRVARR